MASAGDGMMMLATDRDKNDASGGGASGLAGAIRGTLRGMFPGLTFHRPMFRPPRVPIKERTAVLHGVIEVAHEQVVHTKMSAKEKEGFFRKKMAQAPTLLRTGALGVSFSSAQLMLTCLSLAGFMTWTTFDIATQVLSSKTESQTVGTKVGISLVAGGCAGALHGFLWGKSEKLVSRFAPPCLPSHTRGMVISHGSSHLAMFASYEGTKAYLVDACEWDPTMAIVVAGSVSGVVVDIVSHFAAPFEHFSFGVAVRQLKHVRMPTVSEMGKSAFATLLGWIAYENAREQMEAESATLD
ncbi:Aste57867_14518 [Aphanomyces stellatus]|uniref:Aste57867_14518 protein n=1 Tax=Aphanomyces stellatus TaxID=120398 RepID=A0A485L175_9STRA|nr:hypothetical protein As57867_014464 [Aphanomyces stellatus]VFT91340.1 Aste57867_14518 [Aphanomyces stellatus]